MKKNIYLWLSMLAPVYAAKPLNLWQLSPQTALQSSHAYTLAVKRTNQDEQQQKHVHSQQTYLGFPVFGGHAVMHYPQGFTTGTVYLELDKDLGPVPADFLSQKNIALNTVKAMYPNGAFRSEKVEPMVYVDQQNHAVWAYQIELYVTYPNHIPKRPMVILAADTLQPIVQWNNIQTEKDTPVVGSGYGGNQGTGLYQFGADFPALHIERKDKSGLCELDNKDVFVVDMNHWEVTLWNSPMTFQCKQPADAYWTGKSADGYDKYNGGYSPSDDAMAFGTAVYEMYRQWFGFSPLGNYHLPMRVHFGVSYQNAFWDGAQVTFGDGGSMFYPLVSMGIVAHEVSHGFTEKNSGLMYMYQPGGINEAFSDMAAQALEYYLTGKNTWEIGREIMKNPYRPLRYMEKPSLDGKSIDDASQYSIFMDVHYTSGVFNRLFYLLAHQPGWNVQKAFTAMVKANRDYWGWYSGYSDAGCGVMHAAKDLDYDVQGVKNALQEVKVSYKGCRI